MIDLHCHLLPGIDDGAPDEATSLAMARIAVADGIRVTACTPHIYPGLYENDTRGILARIAALQSRLDEEGIALRLVCGADAHLTPELIVRLKAKTAPTLNGGRYFLLEPPHHVMPPRFEESVFEIMVSGYVPVITHPERLTWIKSHYDIFDRLARRGAWMQVTAGSLVGRFGPDAQYWGERMAGEGLVHLLATDAHGVKTRPPRLEEGRAAAERFVGAEEARRLVVERPQAILDSALPESVAPIPALHSNRGPALGRGWWERVFRR
ncbi:MAG: tyrosine-protein phosphatase [Casimicrobiaceae bacterium]